MKIGALATGLFLGVVGTANAGTVTIDVAEAGGNVVFSGSGSIDLAGATLVSLGNLLNPTGSGSDANGFIGVAPTVFLSAIGKEYNFATGTFTALTSATVAFTAVGNPFGYSTATNGTDLVVDAAYNSGDSINFTWTAVNTTASALGINFGTIANFGTNSIEVTSGTINSGGVGDTQIPLPASALLLFGALSGLIVRRSRLSRT